MVSPSVKMGILPLSVGLGMVAAYVFTGDPHQLFRAKIGMGLILLVLILMVADDLIDENQRAKERRRREGR